MKIIQAKYLVSSPKVELCPAPEQPEFAFIGRSNVGKSSLINYLTGNSNLAKTSAHPGKTKLINHFLIKLATDQGLEESESKDEVLSTYFVDLPGYGYAKTSKGKREYWLQSTIEYLAQRENLNCLFLLIDGSIPLQKIDIEFMKLLAEKQVPFALIFTKIDKSNKAQNHKYLETFKTKILENWSELPPIFQASSKSKLGKDLILDYVFDLAQNYQG
jgi:GTP-binding protein